MIRALLYYGTFIALSALIHWVVINPRLDEASREQFMEVAGILREIDDTQQQLQEAHDQALEAAEELEQAEEEQQDEPEPEPPPMPEPEEPERPEEPEQPTDYAMTDAELDQEQDPQIEALRTQSAEQEREIEELREQLAEREALAEERLARLEERMQELEEERERLAEANEELAQRDAERARALEEAEERLAEMHQELEAERERLREEQREALARARAEAEANERHLARQVAEAERRAARAEEAAQQASAAQQQLAEAASQRLRQEARQREELAARAEAAERERARAEQAAREAREQARRVQEASSARERALEQDLARLSDWEQYQRQRRTQRIDGEQVPPLLFAGLRGDDPDMLELMRFYRMEVVIFPPETQAFLVRWDPGSDRLVDVPDPPAFLEGYSNRVLHQEGPTWRALAGRVARQKGVRPGELRVQTIFPHQTADYFAWRQLEAIGRLGLEPREVRWCTGSYERMADGRWEVEIVQVETVDGRWINVR